MRDDEEVQHEVVAEDESMITVSFAVPEDNVTVLIVPEFPIVALLLVLVIVGMVAYTKLAKHGNSLWP
jgi:hypothetical protein